MIGAEASTRIAPARIAGVAGGPPSGREVEQLLAEAQAGVVRSEAESSRCVERFGDIALGWIGSGGGKVGAAGRVACVLDGTIFNADELGRAKSEAELVCELWERHGAEDALARLNGDFALAVCDREGGRLWLARDRFGIRPLYFRRAADRLSFSSRLRSLVRGPDADRTVNRTYAGLVAAGHYRYFDNDPWASPYEAISQLPAGWLVSYAGGSVETTRWWTLAEEPDFEEGAEELAERYRDLLLDAVGRRVAAARAPAFTLSGGMDSSSVIASAVRVTGDPQHAFSTVYSGSEYDESDEISSMLDSAVSEWHRVAVDEPDVPGLVARMIEAHDEPVATATWLSHYVLCEHASGSGFSTLFGGLGGDELNAGEYEYFLYRFADLRAADRDDELAREVERWATHHDHPIFRKNAAVVEESVARLTDPAMPGKILPDRRRIERYADALNPEFFDLRAYEPEMDHPFASHLKNRTYQDIFRETAPCCLRAEDRQTAAFGMRNADPFFDHRLAELMFRVPGELKIRDGITKRLLRDSMRGVLPEETRTRIAKTGWNAPADAWFSGSGQEMLRDLVGSEQFRDRGIYDIGEVERLIAQHEQIVSSGRPAENHMMFLWQLVNLELWFRWLDEL